MAHPIRKSFIACAVVLGAAGSYHVHVPQEADACGCFVPPDPTVPIVQAGERILFGMENGVVTAHIQVQYSGPAEEFGWLLPLPSIPDMELGTDEVFAQLTTTTQPRYRLDREYLGDCPFDPNGSRGGFGSPTSDNEGAPDAGGGAGGSPLVLRDTVGPYDFAVLRANAKEPMLDWLDENGFFVPGGTEDVVDAYIQPNGYFLALKLLKGNDVGDLQPVVLKYESDLPMIPIILTSVAADPDMGVQVWVLGDSRAIPRNYHHTKINDAALDWLNAGANYAQVVTDAVDEIEGHHSFVTEYAGSSDVMKDVLDYPGRFGVEGELAARTDAESFVEYLTYEGFAIFDNTGVNGFNPSYPAQVLSILQAHLPVPQALLDDDITPTDYYYNMSYYLGAYREQNPEKFSDLDTDFDAPSVARQLFERVAEPTLAAGDLIKKHPYLSRMFTTLSPNEMTKDPVFSFNPDLPEVSNEHTGTLTYYCHLMDDPTIGNTPAILETEQGFKLSFKNGTGETSPGVSELDNPYLTLDMPQSHYQEVLREEGDAEVLVDNTPLIRHALGQIGGNSGGCSVGGGDAGWLSFGLVGLGLFALGRRRRDDELEG